jgi:MFS family permease
MSDAPQPTRRLPRAIWALGFVSLLMDVSSEAIHSLLPVFMATVLGASMLTIGLLEGAAEATALITKVFSGALSDWWGKRKPLAVLGYSLGALSKPLFALAGGMGLIVTARLLDRIGKGVRGAPRDALVADIAPPHMRGAAFGLRQSLDTAGAFIGPLLAMGLMLLWANDFRAVFWAACVPAMLCVALLVWGVREPERPDRAPGAIRTNPISRANLARLSSAYWWVVAIGAVFTLARFSEAFLVLRAEQGGLPLAATPLVLIALNLVFSVGAYPLGRLSDSVSHTKLLVAGLLVLIAADGLLAWSNQGAVFWTGVALWGLHMALTQGLLATMVANAAPADLRGTAYGMFNLVCGLSLLLASGLAGWLWDRLGAPSTFVAGMLFAALALLAVAWRGRASAIS